jgi:hypothetical protein
MGKTPRKYGIVQYRSCYYLGYLVKEMEFSLLFFEERGRRMEGRAITSSIVTVEVAFSCCHACSSAHVAHVVHVLMLSCCPHAAGTNAEIAVTKRVPLYYLTPDCRNAELLHVCGRLITACTRIHKAISCSNILHTRASCV